jgi:chorismate dehydratase
MNYPIAMIPYANMAPYLEMGPPRGCYFVDCLPRNSIAALQSGAVWAAAVPVGGLDALGGLVETVGLYGIAARDRVMSVLFFSDRPLDAFSAPRTVRLTAESASSVRLLYLLMGYRHGFENIAPCAAEGAPANGELVIGDTALRWGYTFEQQGAVKSYGFAADLAALWEERWQLPFVFARWVIRADAPREVKRHVAEWLEGFDDREPALIERAVPKVALRLALPDDYARRYLQLIRRCLTADDLAGQERFRREWAHHSAGRPPAWFTTEGKVAADGTHDHVS